MTHIQEITPVCLLKHLAKNVPDF